MRVEELIEIKDGAFAFEEFFKGPRTLLTCKRKFVKCGAFLYSKGKLIFIDAHANGFDEAESSCTNEVGNCGCPHAEQKLILELPRILDQDIGQLIMCCLYSPCTQCANLIVLSKLFHLVIFETLTEHDKRGEKILHRHGIQTAQYIPGNPGRIDPRSA